MAETGGQRSAIGPSGTIRPGTLTALLQEIAAAPGEAQGGAWESVLRPGAVVGRFELVRELGRGGFGVVWEARDRELGRPVAFKAVRAGGKAAAREERLLREAEAAARLSHPNIVTLFDVGRAEQGPYLVLELLRGQTLATRLKQGPLPVADALRVAVEVAKGLAHAHGEGVVHRDLKPENVFLCEDGQVKVLDLGMAHAFGRRKADGGTAAYMAPEQMAGAPEDERTDVFALGLMLFEMLSGKLPFPDTKALASSTPAPLIETPEAPGIGDLLERMLAKEPVRRPRDGGSVQEALSSIRDAPARAGPAPAPVRVRRRLPTLAVMGIPAALLGAVLAGVLSFYPRLRPGPSGVTVPSIAVLPFADMSPGKDQEYFADGIAEEILDALAQVDGLRVAGRTSSFSFKGKSVRIEDIGRQLNVGAVLEGSVRKEGNRVRITAQLVDVANGYRVWSQTYGRELTGIFAVQDDIARAVVESLKVKLLPGKGPSAARRRTTSPESHDHYLMGIQLLRQLTPEGARRSRAAFEKALALDPGNAPAQAAMAFAIYSAYGGAKTAAEMEDIQRQALAAAEKAVAMAPDLADGYHARAFLRAGLFFDWAGSQADLERALALGPNDPLTLTTYGALLGTLGRVAEGIALARRAAELDPLSPGTWGSLCFLYQGNGQLSLARSACKRLLDIAPDAVWPRFQQARIDLLQGQAKAALSAYQGIPDRGLRLTGVALAEHDLGHARESDQALDELTAKYAYAYQYQIAQVHAWRGDRDRAFAWLERAYTERDGGLARLKFDPLLRKVRGDPRYAALVKKMKLPAD